MQFLRPEEERERNPSTAKKHLSASEHQFAGCGRKRCFFSCLPGLKPSCSCHPLYPGRLQMPPADKQRHLCLPLSVCFRVSAARTWGVFRELAFRELGPVKFLLGMRPPEQGSLRRGCCPPSPPPFEPPGLRGENNPKPQDSCP